MTNDKIEFVQTTTPTTPLLLYQDGKITLAPDITREQMLWLIEELVLMVTRQGQADVVLMQSEKIA